MSDIQNDEPQRGHLACRDGGPQTILPVHGSQVHLSIVLTTEVLAAFRFRTLKRPRVHMLGLDVAHQCPFGGEWLFTPAPSAFQIVIGVTSVDR